VSVLRGPVAASPWLHLAVGLGAFLVAYGPLLPALIWEWSEFPSLSHGFAIPLISAYLVWIRRERLAALPVQGSAAGLPLLLLALFLLVGGVLVGEPFVARLALVPGVFGVTLFLAGPAITGTIWMALAYLVFMIPMPYTVLKSVMYQSRLMDAAATAQIMTWLGVPVHRDGVLLHLANITLEVADDCSSIPAMAALIALGAAYAQVGDRPRWARLFLTVGAAPLGLMSNIARIVLTSLGAYYFGRIVLDNVIHKAAGTTVFLVTVGLLVGIDALARHWVQRRADAAPPTPAPAPEPGA